MSDQIAISLGRLFDDLAAEADVDQYVSEMKKTLLELIRAGKKVII